MTRLSRRIIILLGVTVAAGADAVPSPNYPATSGAGAVNCPCTRSGVRDVPAARGRPSAARRIPATPAGATWPRVEGRLEWVGGAALHAAVRAMQHWTVTMPCWC